MTSDGHPIYGRVLSPNDAYLARATPEPVLEPDLPIVDTHMHLWHFGDGPPYFVPEFGRDVAACGHNVEATVFIECHAMYRASGPEHLKCVGETEFAVGQAAIAESGKYTSCHVAAGIVAFADLTLGDLTRETMQAHFGAANGRLRGVRQRSKYNADPVVRGPWGNTRPGLYLDENFGRGLNLLSSLGLLFEASIYHPELPEVVAMARSHPDASIVLIHTGSPVGHSSYAGRESENYADWLRDMRELAKCPNVSVKLGGMLMNLANFDFTTAAAPPVSAKLAELWRSHIETSIELFGAERCMVSSNFPVDKAGFGYGTVWNMFKRLTAGCSADEKRLLFSGAARRIYRLEY